MTRLRGLALLLLVAAVSLAGPAAAAHATPSPVGLSAPALGPDCKGDPPMPGSPYGLLTNPPPNRSTGDPFANPDTVSIQSVYGTNFTWWTYDNGCAAGSDILPEVGTSLAELMGFQIPGLAPSWGMGLMSAVVNPTWTDKLDSVVSSTTASIAAGVWYPWLTVALLVVAVLTLVRATRGALPTAITGVAWALLVMVVVSWTVSYPTESTKLLDSGIQTAVGATASGFANPAAPTGQTPAEQAQAALDHQWDVMVRSTLYRSWLQGAFGSADSKTAQTYGPDLFKATHFSWAEWDTYSADPSGQGKAIIDAKAASFRGIADRIESSDPVAYQAFTGNNYWDRIGIGFLSLVEMVVVSWFMLAAAAIILMAYLLIRLIIPVAPVAGVFFMVDPLRDMAIGWLRKIAGLLVMGPLFFLAALVVGRFNAAILSSDLNMVLKLIFIGAVGVVAWRLLKPASMVGKLKIPGLAALANYVGSRHGVAAGIEAEEAIPTGRNATPGHGPVYAQTDRPPAVGGRSAGDVKADEPIVFTATSRSASGAPPVRPSTPIPARAGTFAPRPAALVGGGPAASEDPGSREMEPRALRAMSAVALPVAIGAAARSPQAPASDVSTAAAQSGPTDPSLAATATSHRSQGDDLVPEGAVRTADLAAQDASAGQVDPEA